MGSYYKCLECGGMYTRKEAEVMNMECCDRILEKDLQIRSSGCRCAIETDQYHGWECEITEGACLYLTPSSKACARDYGEGPDAKYDEDDNPIQEEFEEDGDEDDEDDEFDELDEYEEYDEEDYHRDEYDDDYDDEEDY